MKTKAIFCWSGGKDSAYALHKVLSEGQYEILFLLTTLNENFRRVSMHGVREELLDAQVLAIGIPQRKVWVREGSNTEYERQMEALLQEAKAMGATQVIFGDIFLEDLRQYREANLAKVGMTAIFPLWKMDTSLLIRDFMDQGFKTLTCCVSDAYFDESWVGRDIDPVFINELPQGVDPCGENGEYHTFCYAGPVFRGFVPFVRGEKVYKPLEIALEADQQTEGKRTLGFWFCDLLPVTG